MKKWIVSCLAILILAAAANLPVEVIIKATANSKEQIQNKVQSPVYELELKRWGVHNNGTHANETTKGINSALKWAKEKGFKTFKIPDGTYLIAKGTRQADPDARINLVSDMTFFLSDKAVLKKETNEFEIYSVLYLGTDVKNVTVKGGTYIGERDTHDYSKKGSETGGTHEWGTGIEIVGAENVVIDGVKLKKFTGDGIIVSGTTITGSTISETYLEAGGIDDKGNLIAAKGKIRTNSRKVTNFDNPEYNTYRNIYFWLPKGIDQGSKVDVFYYRKDGSFIKREKQLSFYSGESTIPNDADYFKAVFEAPSTKGVKVNRMTVDISKNITIKNSDIGFNRRQGISLVGSDGVKILNNHIHHTNGTAPQSGIDIEPGFYPGKNTVIKGNTFTDNKIQIVLAYGENARIENNRFEQSLKGTVGVHAHKGFRGELVLKNNTFNGTGLTLFSRNSEVINNQFTKGEVKLLGKNIIFRNAKLLDASLSVGSEEGQEVSNVTIQHNGIRPGVLYIWNKQVHLKDVTIKAETKGKGILFGPGNNENVYDRLTMNDIDRKGTVLPAGTYNRCSLEVGKLEINREGKYVLNGCAVKDKANLLSVNDLYGKPVVTIKKSKLVVTENIGYGAAIYILGAQKFELLENTILASKNKSNTPLIKLGPNGTPNSTNVFAAIIKGNKIYSKSALYVVNPTNGGKNAPFYKIEGNTINNAK
ncbi:hypothetical protein QFZ31_005262 [Neobacillus niacini]|uniref:right-handed parallel beta-helix repeat-containing protein n=1 Tax=Neobacillus driksii TaxID=3035913 RepID=UPI00278B8196|nr:right-handed parallel beta-helix repeat-containing protein [Neobacillus niacini]MDQ0975384.1 hypothetical protein [Neobacillus niacini]